MEIQYILLLFFISAACFYGYYYLNKIDKKNNTVSTPVSKNIPEEVLDKNYNEVIEEFAEGKYAEKFQTNLLLKKDEKLIFDIPQISLWEERSAGFKGRTQGFSIRIAKGVSYRFGGFEGATQYELTQIDSGNLILTSKRLVFSGEKTSKEIKLNNINTLEHSENGIVISRSGKQKKEYYNGTDVLGFEITIIPEKDENFEEEVVKWSMSGFEAKSIIQKVVQSS